MSSTLVIPIKSQKSFFLKSLDSFLNILGISEIRTSKSLETLRKVLQKSAETDILLVRTLKVRY